MTTLETKSVKLSDIFADPDYNYRKDMGTAKEQEAFAASIKATGQMMPGLITAETIPDGKPGAGKHLLIAGYRRRLAIEQLGAKTMEVKLVDVKPYSQECYLFNARENIERKDLSTFEKARMCVDFAERFKLTDKDVAEKLRGSTELNAKHVNNLRNNFEKLAPEILEAWQKRHPICSTDRLNALRVLDHAEQITRFNEMCNDVNLPLSADDAIKAMAARGGTKRGVREADKAQVGADGKPIDKADDKPKVTRPQSYLVTTVSRLVAETPEISANDKAVAARVFAFCQGETQSLVIGKVLVYDHAAQVEKEKAEREANKAAKKTENMGEKIAKMSPAEKAALLAMLQGK